MPLRLVLLLALVPMATAAPTLSPAELLEEGLLSYPATDAPTHARNKREAENSYEGSGEGSGDWAGPTAQEAQASSQADDRQNPFYAPQSLTGDADYDPWDSEGSKEPSDHFQDRNRVEGFGGSDPFPDYEDYEASGEGSGEGWEGLGGGDFAAAAALDSDPVRDVSDMTSSDVALCRAFRYVCAAACRPRPPTAKPCAQAAVVVCRAATAKSGCVCGPQDAAWDYMLGL